MTLSLSAQTTKLIQQRLKTGKYKTAEDVVAAAISQLEQQEQIGDFAPGELDLLLAQGEQSGAPLDGEKILGELENLSKRRPKSKAG